MTALVVGGAGSGKSAYGENLLLQLSGAAPKLYLATMEPWGEEAQSRIARHRRARAGRGFTTVEQYRDLAGIPEAAIPAGCGILLEDLGNLCANELFSPAGSREAAEEAVMGGLARLRLLCRHLVIVSNEVFCGGADYGAETGAYLRLLANVHRRLAAGAEAVCEVVCGVPVYWKGEGRDART